MIPWRFVPALVLALAPGILVGCLFQENEQSARPAPLSVRSATPGNATQYNYDPAGRTFVVRFNREFDPNELTSLGFLPPPLSFDGPHFDTAREIVWRDVVLDAEERKVTLFIDGPNVAEPELVVYFSGDDGIRDPLDPPDEPDEDDDEPTFLDLDPTGFHVNGLIDIAPPKTDAAGAVLFVLDYWARGVEPRAGGMRILGLPVVAAQLLDTSHLDLGSPYIMGYLYPDRPYYLIAILDDGDGLYVPGEDWTGYPRSPSHPDLPTGVNAKFISPLINFRIEPPGRLNPPPFE